MSGPGFIVGSAVGLVNEVLGQTFLNPNQGQVFTTKPLPNNLMALYALVITEALAPYNAKYTYIFPLSPSSLIKEFSSLTNIYDVAGPSQQYGVTRVADIYGNTPCNFTIEGTTGWQYHSTDGFANTGVESIALLQSALNQFALLNKEQQDAGNPNLYTLEFYDYFSNTFWQVVPVGPQRIRQNAQRPLLFEYSIRLAGIKSLDSGPAQDVTDELLSNLSSAATQQIGTALTQNINAALVAYTPYTLGVYAAPILGLL